MRYDDPLRVRYDALKAESADPHARGRDFEGIVAEIFDRAGFDVVTNAGAARPRQTDVYAQDHQESYLIEVKWRNAAVGSSDIDDMRSRLQRQPPNVTGVIVTMGGVAEEALREIEQHRATPVLLIDGREVEGILLGSADLRRLLRAKYRQLTVHGQAAEGSPPRAFVASRRDRREPFSIVGSDGAQRCWVTGGGGFHDTVWTVELPDIDWVAAGGAGVSYDFPVPADTLDDLRVACNHLVALNWLTHTAAWTIQQASATWNGIGRESMFTALRERGSRYAELTRLHHREVLAAADACPGGWFTIVADLDARSGRVYDVDISIQLVGVPVDPGEIQRLRDRLDIVEPGYFRPRTEQSIESFRLREPIEVTPTAWIVEHEPDDARDPLWARGIVFTNPIAAQDGDLPVPFEADSHVIATLRSWHSIAETPSSYFLERIEWGRSSDAIVARAIADWRQGDRFVMAPNEGAN